MSRQARMTRSAISPRFGLFLLFLLLLFAQPRTVGEDVAGDLEAAGLPESDAADVVGDHRGMHVGDPPLLEELDDRVGQFPPVPFTPVLGVDEELGDHPLLAPSIDRLLDDHRHREANPAAAVDAPPDVPVLALLREDVPRVGVQPGIRRRLAADFLPVLAEPIAEFPVVGGCVLQLHRRALGNTSIFPAVRAGSL